MKIAEIAAKTGLSAHTLRYYERIGLLPPVRRDSGGRRSYAPDDMAWLSFLQRLRTTGMPIRDMLRYAQLRAQGPQTSAARRTLLDDHRAALRQHVDALQECLNQLDIKITTYDAEIKEQQND